MARFTLGAIDFGSGFGLNMDVVDPGIVRDFGPSQLTPTLHRTILGTETVSFVGTGFTYGATGVVVSGTFTTFTHDFNGGAMGYAITNLSLPVSAYVTAAQGASIPALFSVLLAGGDLIDGAARSELLRGYGGDDTIDGYEGHDTLDGGAGADTIFAGLGNDIVTGGDGVSYLRGGEGDDSIQGGANFDDAHGNMGNDTVAGGGFDDWVVGGQGNDVLFGDDGGDLVYGQLGEDTMDGGAGDDGVVGGQANDLLSGGAGNDFLTGDRGDDTVTGGTGADIFHTNAVQGLDRITDFSLAEGDRIQIDPGNTYTLRQVGADTVIDFGGGNTCVLVGVQMSSLTGDWIFGG